MYSCQQWREGLAFLSSGFASLSLAGLSIQETVVQLVWDMGDSLASSFSFCMFTVLWDKLGFDALSLSYPLPNSSHWEHILLGKSSFIYAADLICQTWAVVLSVRCAWAGFINCKSQWSSLLVTCLNLFLWLEVPKWLLWLFGMIPRSKLKFWSVLYAKRGWLLVS